MNCYVFEAKTTATVKGYVNAETEEEALKKIANGNVDDIYDIDADNANYQNVEIVDVDCEQ